MGFTKLIFLCLLLCNTLLVFAQKVGIGSVTFVPALTLEVHATAEGFPANTGTAQTGILRLSQGTDAGVLDLGFGSIATGGYIQATNSGALGTNYYLILNPNGGNVGIGTKTPAAKLDVAGTIAVNGSTGTSGQVLTSAGSSSPTWSTLSTGPGSGACLPAGVSNTTWASITLQTCATNCAALTEGGYAAGTWRVPTMDEYVYVVGLFTPGGGGWQSQYFSTRTPDGQGGYWLTFYESQVYTGYVNNGSTAYCRCVR